MNLGSLPREPGIKIRSYLGGGVRRQRRCGKPSSPSLRPYDRLCNRVGQWGPWSLVLCGSSHVFLTTRGRPGGLSGEAQGQGGNALRKRPRKSPSEPVLSGPTPSGPGVGWPFESVLLWEAAQPWRLWGSLLREVGGMVPLAPVSGSDTHTPIPHPRDGSKSGCETPPNLPFFF